MLRHSPPLEIPESQPFANDAIGRAVIAENLTLLCQNAVTPYVIALDGAWGTGKTTFFQMWRKQLQNGGFNVLHFNAWENDYADEPGIAFIGEIQSAIDKKKIDLSTHPEITEVWKSVKSFGAKVLGTATPIALKLATHGLLDLSKFKLGEENSSTIADFAESFAKEQIDSYSANKENLQQFRGKLEKFALHVTQPLDASSKKLPLVFLIDELDRCRPTFAVELLERLKHVFSVDGIIFVLAIDRTALAHSIRSVYGQGFDAFDYLRRFFDLRVELPDPDLVEFIRYIFKKIQLDQLLFERKNEEHNFDWVRRRIAAFAKAYQFSMRTIEQAISELYALVAMTPENMKVTAMELGILVSLRHARADLFQAFISGRLSAHDLCDELKKIGVNSVLTGHDGELTEAYLWKWSAIPDEFQREYDRVRGLMRTQLTENERSQEYKSARRKLEIFDMIEREGIRGDLGPYVKSRMQLFYRFQR